MGKLGYRSFLGKVWGVVLLSSALPAYAQTPSVPADSVVNGASFASKQAVSPGTLVSIFGTGLATSMAHADTIPLSTSLAGVSVTMNGVPTPLLDTIPTATGRDYTQLNAQVPWNVLPQGMTSGNATILVTVNGVTSQPSVVQIAGSLPGIFTLNQQGTGQAAVQIGNSAVFAAPAGSINGAQSRPAVVGDVLVMYVTGLGMVDNLPANGDIPKGKVANSIAVPRVLLGGVEAPIQFHGLSPQFVGLNQINVSVPNGVPFGDAVPLQLDLGQGVLSSDKVTIAVGQ